jgi:hypothetical protein
VAERSTWGKVSSTAPRPLPVVTRTHRPFANITRPTHTHMLSCRVHGSLTVIIDYGHACGEGAGGANASPTQLGRDVGRRPSSPTAAADTAPSPASIVDAGAVGDTAAARSGRGAGVRPAPAPRLSIPTGESYVRWPRYVAGCCLPPSPCPLPPAPAAPPPAPCPLTKDQTPQLILRTTGKNHGKRGRW